MAKWRNGTKDKSQSYKNRSNRIRCVSMSDSQTGFSKYSLSGSQNYYLKISVNNVKFLFIRLNTNFGEPGTRYIGIYNVDYYKMTDSQNV